MAQRKKGGTMGSLVLIILLLVALFVVKQCKKDTNVTDKPTTDRQKESRGLNRNPSVIKYSKHARCRMECRHISQVEVKDILANGKINYGKSEISGSADCKKKYAVEGKTDDNQRVRIIFAPCNTEVTVVTVIDLDKEWSCECN